VLTAAQLEAQLQSSSRPKRSLPSLAQQYREYIMQRIEGYKDSLSREDLLRLGDEAASELREGCRGQLLLTEVMMQETFDQQIIRRLNLPSFRKWRSKILPLREAQRDPTHWQIERSDPVAVVLPRLEAGDRALVIGNGAERAAYLLAAHELEVVCLCEDTAAADKVEGILATECLGSRSTVYVAMLGHWLPSLPAPLHLVVIDTRAVLSLAPDRQQVLLARAQELTAPEGLHAIVAAEPDVAPEGCLRHYSDWGRLPLPAAAPNANRTGLRGLLLAGPPARAVPQEAYARPAV
jgi:hypothetical protein